MRYMYSDATVTEAAVYPVATEYPHSTLNNTPACSCHINTVLYETHVGHDQEESGCVHVLPNLVIADSLILIL